MQKAKTILLNMLLVLIVTGCGEEKQNYVPSDENDALPAKTSNGNNLAGALVNGNAWRSNMEDGGFNHRFRDLMEIQTRIIDTVRFLEITFYGEINEGFHERKQLDFIFRLPDSTINTKREIKPWEGDTLRFERDTSSYVWGDAHTSVQTPHEDLFKLRDNSCVGGEGWIHFDKIETINSDKDTPDLLVVGTFELTMNNDCAKMRVRKGRFDFDMEQLNRYN